MVATVIIHNFITGKDRCIREGEAERGTEEGGRRGTGTKTRGGRPQAPDEARGSHEA